MLGVIANSTCLPLLGRYAGVPLMKQRNISDTKQVFQRPKSDIKGCLCLLQSIAFQMRSLIQATLLCAMTVYANNPSTTSAPSGWGLYNPLAGMGDKLKAGYNTLKQRVSDDVASVKQSIGNLSHVGSNLYNWATKSSKYKNATFSQLLKHRVVKRADGGEYDSAVEADCQYFGKFDGESQLQGAGVVADRFGKWAMIGVFRDDRLDGAALTYKLSENVYHVEGQLYQMGVPHSHLKLNDAFANALARNWKRYGPNITQALVSSIKDFGVIFSASAPQDLPAPTAEPLKSSQPVPDVTFSETAVFYARKGAQGEQAVTVKVISSRPNIRFRLVSLDPGKFWAVKSITSSQGPSVGSKNDAIGTLDYFTTASLGAGDYVITVSAQDSGYQSSGSGGFILMIEDAGTNGGKYFDLFQRLSTASLVFDQDRYLYTVKPSDSGYRVIQKEKSGNGEYNIGSISQPHTPYFNSGEKELSWIFTKGQTCDNGQSRIARIVLSAAHSGANNVTESGSFDKSNTIGACAYSIFLKSDGTNFGAFLEGLSAAIGSAAK